MKPCLLTFALASCLSIILINNAYGVDRTEYVIQVNTDGSASWAIRQIGTDIQVSPDTLARFQSNITSLMLAAKTKTSREMSIMSPSITSNVSGSYVSIEYRFRWKNFSRTENSSIIIGDVFQVDNFFPQLYGDGGVTMTYPSGYILETVTPLPMQQDDTHQTLKWAGTKDFLNGLPSVTLREKHSDLLDILEQNETIFAGLVAVAVLSSASYYAFNRHKRKAKLPIEPGVPVLTSIETDEERVVKLLKSSGGSLFQSDVTEKCNFSKAKTSQLLSKLEDKGILVRHKRGRNKIVVLKNKDK